MEVLLQISRKQPGVEARSQVYRLNAEPGQTILDCLNEIKWHHDGSLAFRKNCRNTICGSCAMQINGRSALACKENIQGELARASADPTTGLPVLQIAPLGNLPVIKDLVVDMQPFWQGLQAVDPYVSSNARQGREFLQTPQERAQLEATGNCIMCGACYAECNAKQVNPDFVGPHALAKAYRLVADNRDRQTEQRLAKYNQGTQGVWGCTRCYLCNFVCPMGVAPMDQISKIKQVILAEAKPPVSTAIRHRKTLVNLVKAGGWIDERRFALQVLASWRELLKIAPLGLRMLARGKLPLDFKPSQGTKQVRSLIEAVTESAKNV